MNPLDGPGGWSLELEEKPEKRRTARRPVAVVRSWLRRSLDGRRAAATLALAFAVAALAFAWPWLFRSGPSEGGLERYVPRRDGAAALTEYRGPEGRTLSWESRNLALVPDLRAMNDLRRAQQEAIQKPYLEAGETALPADEVPSRLAEVRVIQHRARTLEAGGGTEDTAELRVRDPRGESLVGYYDAENDRDLIFDPHLLLLPSDLGPDSEEWTSTGSFDEMDYEARGRVLETGPFEGPLGRFADCLRVEMSVTFSQGGAVVRKTTFRDRYCAGVGLVEAVELDAGGEVARRGVVLSTDEVPGDPDLSPPELVDEGPPPEGPGSWSLTRMARTVPTGDVAESTIAPLWIPTDPPVLLAASRGGDLVALDPADAGGEVVWRFRAGGTVYGQPAFDPENGRIFFGATDKRLYALDARGLFLWSFETGDSVASRPLLAGDTVIFGSEDRSVYGVDAATGELRWSHETGGPVASSAALAGGVAVIGSDDGAVYGLDPETGERLWLRATGGPVEAPVVSDGETAYVASRDGELYALDGASGEEAWRSGAGLVLDSAPVLGEDDLFVVNEDGRLSAFDRESGRKLWDTGEERYAGTPALAGETLVVAGEDGDVYRFGLDGEEGEPWRSPGAGAGDLTKPTFQLGPTVGGGAVWLAASNATVSRLGPADGLAGPAPLSAAWVRDFTEAPFVGGILGYTAAEYRGRALVLDSERNVYLVDPATGEGESIGSFAPDGGSPTTEPVIAGDTLLAVAGGNALHATGLPDGEERWRFESGETSLRPAAAADGIAFWISAGEGEPGEASGALHALDLATGEEAWRRPIEGFGYAGGTVVRGDTVFASTPPAAYDRSTGGKVWEAEGLGVGGPVLDEEGERLFAGLMSPDGEEGSIVALDAGDGSELWRADLGQDTLDPAERPWLSGDALIVPTGGGDIVALDEASGEERWRYEPPSPRLGAITVEGGRVWLALQNARTLVLDAESGEPVGRFAEIELDLNDFSYFQRPVVIGGKAIYPIGPYLLGIEAPGGGGP